MRYSGLGSSSGLLRKRSTTGSSWDRRGGGGVVVAERGYVERLAHRHRERRQGDVEVGRRQLRPRMVELPEVPEAIDHAVVSPEERIVGRGFDVSHRAADRAV